MRELKTCAKCKEVKELSEFSPHNKNKSGVQSRCKVCCASVARQRRNASINKANNLKKYGITTAEWNAMFEAQGGCCKLCGRPHSTETKATLLVCDHNHATGKVRGLLCSWCNRGLGFLQDNPELVKKAARYLEQEGYYG